MKTPLFLVISGIFLFMMPEIQADQPPRVKLTEEDKKDLKQLDAYRKDRGHASSVSKIAMRSQCQLILRSIDFGPFLKDAK